MPTLASRAAGSDTLFPDAWAQWQLLQPTATFVEMDGVEHMLPIEAPVDTAVVVALVGGIGRVWRKGNLKKTGTTWVMLVSVVASGLC